ncbi:MAG: right-handed parallel beta-helix repeat-containing protein [Saprospiraceae bacterium]|nr:right-handed parallel beta-helix repeat-containing protein [Saprospiraceae bacterium]
MKNIISVFYHKSVRAGLCLSVLALMLAWTLPDDKPTVFLCGDSTMANKALIDAPETGWGMVFPEFFTDAVRIENHAVNGRSTKSFRTLGHWKGVMDKVKQGDYVVLQFGHNDQKEGDTTRYAAPQTDYKKNLTRFIEEIKAKGANPILATPVNRRKFDDKGVFVDQHGEYPSVVRALAKELHIPLLDMHQKSQKVIEAHGVEGSKNIFMHFIGGYYLKHPKGIEDNTHFSRYGAELMASLAAESLVEIGHPLRSFLKKSPFEEKYAFELPKICLPAFRRDTYNIVRYGAKPDGVTLNTQAINQAIDMAHQAGGGVVLIPSGVWLTAGIVLKSNVNLHLNKGALVLFTDDKKAFPLVVATYEGVETYRCQAPISATDAENIAVTGDGIFDGNGQVWRMLKRSKVNEAEWKKITALKGGVFDEKKENWYPSEQSYKGNQWYKPGLLMSSKEEYETIHDFLRPNMVVINRCKKVLLEGVTFQNSPAWTMHPLLTEHLTIRNVLSKAPSFAQNSDALDLESCRNVLVEGCHFDVGDDGITLKSGRDEFGRKRGIPTENVIIKDTKVYQAHGGFVIGSEMSGGVRNIFVSNCTFMGSDIGLRFKTTRGRGGIVENIYISDITMSDIPAEAILFDMYYNGKEAAEALKNPQGDLKPVNEGTPQFRNFFIRNITCRGAQYGVFVQGLPEMNVQNVVIENAVLQAKKAMFCTAGEGIQLKNVQFIAEEKDIKVVNSKKVVVNGVKY